MTSDDAEWVPASEAARILGVTDRMARILLAEGSLEGEQRGKREQWWAKRASVEQMRLKRIRGVVGGGESPDELLRGADVGLLREMEALERRALELEAERLRGEVDRGRLAHELETAKARIVALEREVRAWRQFAQSALEIVPE